MEESLHKLRKGNEKEHQYYNQPRQITERDQQVILSGRNQTQQESQQYLALIPEQCFSSIIMQHKKNFSHCYSILLTSLMPLNIFLKIQFLSNIPFIDILHLQSPLIFEQERILFSNVMLVSKTEMPIILAHALYALFMGILREKLSTSKKSHLPRRLLGAIILSKRFHLLFRGTIKAERMCCSG